MSDSSKNRILIVDDDPSIRAMVATTLSVEGYEVATAEDGFDALLQLKTKVPELIVSDLNMPHMSGFEFLSVIRRRFPEILVVAMSGAYESGDAIPGGVIADAFYAKGSDKPGSLSRLIGTCFELQLRVPSPMPRSPLRVGFRETVRTPEEYRTSC